MRDPEPLSGGEGGFVLTDDDTYHRVITLAHFDKRAKTEIPEGHPLARYAVTGAGLKLRIHPLAIAHDQLARLDGYPTGPAAPVAAPVAERAPDGADGPRWTRSSILAASARTAASSSAVAGFSSAARRRSATAEHTPAAAVPTRTTSSRGNPPAP
ncbi:hypothetical protein [Kitasatospora azatica]|uniref:hypothetical protein n=1 Tax=Kitasatospora azatica TaxID=58347 RepID=UPI0018DE3E8A|nr:hypothetical protein [Kitasatospora azatica]